MKDEEGHGPIGSPRRKPDRLDAWFCRIALIIVAVLILMILYHAMQVRPADPAAKHVIRSRILG
jgi:hypothetical protein